MAGKNEAKDTGGWGCLVSCLLLAVYAVIFITVPSSEDGRNTSSDPKPAPYVPGEPGFKTLDNYNVDSNGNRVTNEDKAYMRDAINKFNDAQNRRNAGD